MVILGYPLMDTMLAMARRRIRGKPMFSSDREHIHHRLLAIGLNHKWASLVLYGVCLLFSLLAIALYLQNNALSISLVIPLAGVLLWGLYRLGYVHLLSSKDLTQERLLFRAAHQLSALVRTRLLLAQHQPAVFELLRHAAQDFGSAALVLNWNPAQGPAQRFEYLKGADGTLQLAENLKSTQLLPRPDLEEHLSFGNGELEVHLYFGGPAAGDLLVEHKTLLNEVFQAGWTRLRELQPQAPDAPQTDAVRDAAPPVPAPDSVKKDYPTPNLT
jgi:hypothetical protein